MIIGIQFNSPFFSPHLTVLDFELMVEFLQTCMYA